MQFGNEEEIRQQLFIPSPTPDLQTSYTFIATTDRDWMRVEPPGGTIGQDGVTVTVITNPVGLPVGTNTGTVTMTFIAIAGGEAGSRHDPVTGSTPVSVTLVTPVTNKGKDSPVAESLIIPAVAHATGVNSEWQTDVRVLNLGSEKQKYRLLWTSTGTDATLGGKTCELELAPGQNAALDDVVKQWYGLGSLPGEGATGVLEIRPLGTARRGQGSAGNSGHALSRLARLVADVQQNPAGNSRRVHPRDPVRVIRRRIDSGRRAKKSILSLQQLAQSSGYRTNVGVAEASGQPVSVEIRFFDGERGELLTVPLSLKPGEHRQLNQVLADERTHERHDAARRSRGRLGRRTGSPRTPRSSTTSRETRSRCTRSISRRSARANT